MSGRSDRWEEAIPRAAGGGTAARSARLARGEFGGDGVGAIRDVGIVVVGELGVAAKSSASDHPHDGERVSFRPEDSRGQGRVLTTVVVEAGVCGVGSAPETLVGGVEEKVEGLASEPHRRVGQGEVGERERLGEEPPVGAHNSTVGERKTIGY